MLRLDLCVIRLVMLNDKAPLDEPETAPVAVRIRVGLNFGDCFAYEVAWTSDECDRTSGICAARLAFR